MKPLLILIIALANVSTLFGCQQNQTSQIQFNFLTQACRELERSLTFADEVLAGLQAYKVLALDNSVTIEVCYVPPIVYRPSLARVTQLMGTIYDFPNYQPILEYLPSKACYAYFTSPKTCANLVIIPYSGCPDSQLFTSEETLEQVAFYLRGVPSLISADSGVLWSRLSTQVSNLLDYMQLFLNVQDTLPPSTENSFSLIRVAESLSTQSSAVQSLLEAIYRTKTYAKTSLESDINADLDSVINRASQDWTQMVPAIISDFPAYLDEKSCEHPLKWRSLIQSLPQRAFQMISLAFNHTAVDLSDPFSFSSLPAPKTRLSAYSPSHLALKIDALSVTFYSFFSSLLNQLKSTFPTQMHLLNCYQRKMEFIRNQFNMTYFMTDSDHLCQIQQEYGLFEGNFLDSCARSCLTNLAQTNNLGHTEIVSFDFLASTESIQSLNRTLDVGDISNRVHWTGFTSVDSTNTSLQLHREITSDWNISGVLCETGIMQIQYGSLVSFDTLESSITKRHQSSIDNRTHKRGVETASAQEEASSLPPCDPGYYSVFNSVSERYECVGCPIGSYCLGTDGLNRLCSNGPLDRVTYTHPLQTNANCPWICSDNRECRSGNGCIVLGPGQYCNETAQFCPSLSWPSLWSFDNGCTAEFHHLAIVSSGAACHSLGDAPWCRFTKIPGSDYDLSFRLRFDTNPSTNTTINLITAVNQFKIDITTTTSLVSSLVYTQYGPSGFVLRSTWTRLTLRQWYRIRMVVSTSNYLLMTIDDAPILYSFFDTSLIGHLPNSGTLSMAEIGMRSPTSFFYSISNLVLSNYNDTSLSDFLTFTPASYFGLHCDLSTSELLEDGSCIAPCPNGYNRVSLPGNRAFCLCGSSCDRSSSVNSNNVCQNKEFLLWKGRYMKLEITQGSAFIAAIDLKDEFGTSIDVPKCGHLSGYGCSAALHKYAEGGWMAKGGDTAVFYLPEAKKISEIGILFRSTALDAKVVLSVSLSPLLWELLNNDADLYLVRNWTVYPIDFGTSLAMESMEWLSPKKAHWLQISPIGSPQTPTLPAPIWKMNSDCVACPASSLSSTFPRTSAADCLCPSGALPWHLGASECQPATQCPNFEVQPSVASGLYSGPLAVSFTVPVSNWPQSADVRIEAAITSTVSGVSSVLTLRLSERIHLPSSCTVTFSASLKGCLPSSTGVLKYDIKPRCGKPLIVVSGSGSSTVVSLFGPNGASIAISIDPAPTTIDRIPQFKPYIQSVQITSNALIRAQSTSTGNFCSPSEISMAFVDTGSDETGVESPTLAVRKSCNTGCIVAAIFVSLFVVAIFAIVLYLIMGVKRQ